MRKDFDRFRGRSLRLPSYDYSQPGYYFITICTKDRECLFGYTENERMILNNYGKTAKKEWLKIANYFRNIVLDKYIVMPNHVHGIIGILYEIRDRHNSLIDHIIEEKNQFDVATIHELSLQDHELSLQEKNIRYRRNMLLPRIIGKFKMNSAKRINELIDCTGDSLWQRNYYEHIIRNSKELHTIRNYVGNNSKNWQFDRNNPVNV